MNSENKLYRFYYRLTYIFIRIFYRLRIYGRENIPEGSALICANHSSNIDPFLIAYAFGINHQLHIIAKIQLFKIPILSSILKKVGMISVDRDVLDTSSVKATLNYLKSNEKVLIFPEGRRISQGDSISAKSGAVKLAERAAAPIIPVHIPRKKPIFRKVTIIIGEPYFLEKPEKKRQSDDYVLLSESLMEKIEVLDEIRKMG
ncbi:MAG: 1-acyl-sn-glycerol-3-phosphate acyltransferase [Oscillospiraceae bacterium]|nr:1-acyl-sn-glycerol-3-phosphate acyltransferase [Oscillospiraceae bacterium]